MVKNSWPKMQKVKTRFCFVYNLLTFLVLGFDSSKQEIEKSVSDLQRQTWIVLRKKVDEELADNLLLLKLRNR